MSKDELIMRINAVTHLLALSDEKIYEKYQMKISREAYSDSLKRLNQMWFDLYSEIFPR